MQSRGRLHSHPHRSLRAAEYAGNIWARSGSVSPYLEERIVYRERFQARTLDFRSRIAFVRYDECEFVMCTILIDDETESLAFTRCSFEDCNISELRSVGG